MTVDTRPTTPATLPLRVHLLERKISEFQPPEGEDLTAVIASLNRLYVLTQTGAVSFPAQPLTWDLPDDQFFYGPSGMNTSLSGLVLGDHIPDYGLSTKPFIERVLGGEETGNRFGARSLVQIVLGSNDWDFEDDAVSSLASKTLGSQMLVTQLLDDPETGHGSVLSYIKAVEAAHTIQVQIMQADIDSLLQRVSDLENS
ncbi:hypothetical protein [Neorhizobium tomejilense]|uniref:hypothetical protein n=1 Tax=Neorhizobium tomejilense TaxID=2093828 RepID=UPI003ECF00D3